MKIITLNTWGGRIKDDLLRFFEEHQDVDIFCLQEIYNDANPEDVEDEFKKDFLGLFGEIKKLLPDHIGHFRPQIKNIYGLAIFVKKSIQIEEEGDVLVYEVENYTSGSNHPRNLQYIRFSHEGQKLLVANVHGLWTGQGKNDTPERIDQSRRIKDFLDKFSDQKILCGDFNLEPDTQSVAMLEQDMTNLIKSFNITSTRTLHYQKPGKFADYIFVSKEVQVVRFEVLDHIVSDHCPLLLEI